MPFSITLQQATFIVIAMVVLGSALMVVSLKNIFHSLLFLALSFLGVAGVYLLLSADFLAAVQVLVYIGAITVLLMFALMLTHRIMNTNLRQTTEQIWLAIPVTIGILVVFVRVFVLHPWSYIPGAAKPTTGIIGQALLRDYLLPFELASIVLLVAMIGAIVLAKEDKPDGSA
ncbi:MAG: NADH-quinone oxidoreductase subunit J family protein [Armatimonadota bacterium]